MTTPAALPVAGRTDVATDVSLTTLGSHTVCLIRIEGGPHRGAVGSRGAAAVTRGLALAEQLAIPVVAVLDTSGAEITEGVSSLHGWGRIARALTRVSGAVPITVILRGACVSGPALLLGIADIVIMCEPAFAYVSGPGAVREFTGVDVERDVLGGSAAHALRSGVASFVVSDSDEALELAEGLLDYLPDHHLADPPTYAADDPVGRESQIAARTIPAAATASYDVHDVVGDIVDCDSLLELRSRYAPNLVTAFARIAGRSIGVVANQPNTRAGTLDIEASRKAAHFVGLCDAFNLPILTFVDTPGFEPGRDLEWRGMIRHGAELVHAYCAATVPRVCVVLRKAYGGAYIVMDSRGVGNDVCLAWPSAQIAVMGGDGAIQVLHGRELDTLDLDERASASQALLSEYEGRFLNPYRAVEIGVVDAVIDPLDTRSAVAAAFEAIDTKRGSHPGRKHSNTPL